MDIHFEFLHVTTSLTFVPPSVLIRSASRLQSKYSFTDKEKLRKTAQCIEQLLFLEHQKEGNKIQDYGDVSNFKQRLVPFLLKLLQRKAATAVKNCPQECRRQALRSSLGSPELYEGAIKLVEDIKNSGWNTHPSGTPFTKDAMLLTIVITNPCRELCRHLPTTCFFT